VTQLYSAGPDHHGVRLGEGDDDRVGDGDDEHEDGDDEPVTTQIGKTPPGRQRIRLLTFGTQPANNRPVNKRINCLKSDLELSGKRRSHASHFSHPECHGDSQ